MKLYGRGTRLANKSKSELQNELDSALKELARLDSIELPDARMSRVSANVIHARRNAVSHIARLRAALRIISDAEYVEMIESR